MASQKLAESFVQEIVIGFGFFTGFWILIGIDPEALLVNTVLDALKPFSASMATTLGLVYWLIGIGLATASILSAYKIGRWVGLLAVFFAFFGGLLLTSIGVWLLIFGVLLGFIAPFLKGDNSTD